MKLNRKTSKKASKGFTLLELLVVVIIIGVLGSLALPQMFKMQTKARTAEAASIVGSILTAEWLYFQEKNVFTSTGSDLMFDIPANGTTYFNYSPTANAAAGTGATATLANATVVARGNGAVFNSASVPTTVTVTGVITSDGKRTITTNLNAASS